jgi:hypothetical protein
MELPKIRQMIEEYNNGCLTQAQICAKYNIPLSTFSYYKNSSKSKRGMIQPSPEDYEQLTQHNPIKTTTMPQNTQKYAPQPLKTIEVTYNEHPRVRHSGQVYESVDVIPSRQEHQSRKKVVDRISNGELDKLFHLHSK